MAKLITAKVEFQIEVDDEATDEEILDQMRDLLVDQVGYIVPEIIDTEIVEE